MPLIDSSNIPEVLMREGVSGKFLADARTGTHGLTVLLNVVEPGAAIPLHRHSAEWNRARRRDLGADRR